MKIFTNIALVSSLVTAATSGKVDKPDVKAQTPVTVDPPVTFDPNLVKVDVLSTGDVKVSKDETVSKLMRDSETMIANKLSETNTLKLEPFHIKGAELSVDLLDPKSVQKIVTNKLENLKETHLDSASNQQQLNEGVKAFNKAVTTLLEAI